MLAILTLSFGAGQVVFSGLLGSVQFFGISKLHPDLFYKVWAAQFHMKCYLCKLNRNLIRWWLETWFKSDLLFRTCICLKLQVMRIRCVDWDVNSLLTVSMWQRVKHVGVSKWLNGNILLTEYGQWCYLCYLCCGEHAYAEVLMNA